MTHTPPPHLSLVLGLEPQPRLDAAPRLQEGLALGAVRQVADEDAGGVHAQEEDHLSRHLRTDGQTLLSWKLLPFWLSQATSAPHQ